MAEGKKSWSEAEIKVLILMYEENTVLWDVTSANYRNRNKKQETLQLLATQFNTDCIEISRKLHNLRTQFMHEVRKLKVKKSRSGEVFNSSWPYFSAMKFIQRSEGNSKSTDNFNLNSSQSESSLLRESGPSSRVQVAELQSPPKKKHSKKTSCRKVATSPEDLKKTLNLINQPVDGEQIFADYVASEMRILKNHVNKRKIKRMINELLMEISETDAAESESQRSNASSPSDLSSRTHIDSCTKSFSNIPSPIMYSSCGSMKAEPVDIYNEELSDKLSNDSFNAPSEFVPHSEPPSEASEEESNITQGTTLPSTSLNSKKTSRKRIFSEISSIEKAIDKFGKFASENKITENEFDFFCKSLSVQLNNMPLDRALVCQEKLQKVMTEERLRQFRMNSTSSYSTPL